MKFVVSIHQDEDGVYIAECPSIPGCVSQGQTEAEATLNVTDAIRQCLAVRAEVGMPLRIARQRGAAPSATTVNPKPITRAMKETRYLLSIPDMKKSIVRGVNTPVNECLKRLPW